MVLYALTRQEKTLVQPPTAHALGVFFRLNFLKQEVMALRLNGYVYRTNREAKHSSWLKRIGALVVRASCFVVTKSCFALSSNPTIATLPYRHLHVIGLRAMDGQTTISLRPPRH